MYRMYRKIFSAFIAVTVIAGTMLPAYAAQTVSIKATAVESGTSISDESKAKVSKDRAKEIAVKALKDFFDTEVDGKKFETSIQYREDYSFFGYSPNRKNYVWEIGFQSSEANRHKSIMVSVDANSGKITNVNSDEYNFMEQEQPKVAAITEDQAKEVAKNFLNRINPEEMKQVQPADDGFDRYPYMYYPVQYNFRYIRTVNGIKFDNDGLMVGVDGVSGKITSYSCRWSNDVDFPPNQGVVDRAKAEQTLYDEAEMELGYIPYRGKYYYEELPQSVKLVYMARFPKGGLLDAKEGKIINQNIFMDQTSKMKDLTPGEKEQFIAKWKAIPKLDRELDSSGATEVIKSKVKELAGDGYEINSIRYEENTNSWESRGRKIWSAQFNKKENNNPYGAPVGSITVDASTGQLVSIDKFNRMEMQDSSEFTPKLTWEEAYSKSVDLISRYYPDKVKEIKTEQRYFKYTENVNGKEIPERIYYFNFPRTVNGIGYDDNRITVSFDIKTGTVNELRCFWDDKLDFPAIQGTISKEDAKKAYFKSFAPELAYAMINKSSDISKPEMAVNLVYRLKPANPYAMSGNIDAFTGKWINYTGEEADKSLDVFKQAIKGHWAERQLGILAFQGIIDTANFDINKVVTRMDAVKMLVNAKGYRPYTVRDVEELKFTNIQKDTENYKYLQMAVKHGIIENKAGEFKGDEKVTREEVAELIVKLFRYDRLAKAQDIFILPFVDAKEVSSDKVGYVAIGKGLGIFSGSDGKFRPKDNVTVPEMAVIIYRALDSLKNNTN